MKVIAILLLLCASAQARVVVIANDRGGQLVDYLSREQEYFINNDRLEIRGECDSACTLFLGLAGVCVAPEARLGFHRAMSGVRGIADFYTDMLWDHYPEAVKRKLGSLTSKVVYLTGGETGLPRCP